MTDEKAGTSLAEHHVQLDESAQEYRALADLYEYLRWHGAPDPDGRPSSEGTLLAKVGAWAGREVLGPTVGRRIATAAAPVRVVVPAEAGFLLSWPLDLAHVDGVPLAERSKIGFVFELPSRGPVDPGDGKRAVGTALRMLAVFNGPDQISALGLRRERLELMRLIRDISVRQGRRIELRVLQYGTTRARLREIAADRGGWDVVHLSGHGGVGSFVLETAEGGPDLLSAAELAEILQPTRARVKLTVTSACASAAGTLVQTLTVLGLDGAAAELAGQQREPSGPGPAALAQQLAEDLACPVVAMRYLVDDDFAIAFAGLAGMADRFHAAIDGLAADLHEEIGPTRIPGSVAEVTYWVEETDGVRFGMLVASLADDPGAAEALLGEILTAARIAGMGGPAIPW